MLLWDTMWVLGIQPRSSTAAPTPTLQTLNLNFWDRVSPYTWNSLIGLTGWPVSSGESEHPSIPTPSSLGLHADLSCQVQSSPRVPKIHTQVLVPVQQALSQRELSPWPLLLFFKNTANTCLNLYFFNIIYCYPFLTEIQQKSFPFLPGTHPVKVPFVRTGSQHRQFFLFKVICLPTYHLCSVLVLGTLMGYLFL